MSLARLFINALCLLYSLLGVSSIAARGGPYLRFSSRDHLPIGLKQADTRTNHSSNMTSRIQELTNQYAQGAANSVAKLAIVTEPSEKRPFIFFHLRKAGGSTVRDQLVQAAKKKYLQSFVACHDGVPCETYNPPQEFRDDGNYYAIYGGHFYYPSMLKSLYVSERLGSRVAPSNLNFDCFVLLRKPSSRVQSCWNYRMVQEGSFFQSPPALADMDAGKLAQALPQAMSMYGEGCNNEALRVLSNSGSSEEVVNAATSGPDSSSSMAPVLLEETLGHMQQCVVGVLERCEDTMRAVRGYFPWFSNFDCKNFRERQGKIKKSTLSPAIEAEVARQNMLEESVYEVGNALLDAQLLRLNPREPTASAESALPQLVEEGAGHRSQVTLAVVASAVMVAILGAA